MFIRELYLSVDKGCPIKVSQEKYLEIVKQTEKELVLKSKFFYGCFVFFVFLPIGMPLFMNLAIILWEMGVIRVSCQRVEPTQVNCQVNQSRYLGLTQDASTSLTQVTEAKFNFQNSQDSDGNTQLDYFMTLLTQKGKEIVAWQGASSFNGVKGYPQEMNEMARKISTFINNSTESSLVIQYDLRWKKENLISLVITPFLGIGILLLYMSCRETVIFSKSDQRLNYKTFSSSAGIKIKNCSFAQIKELIIESDTDSDENTYYSLKLVLPAKNNLSKVTLISDSDIEKVRKLANIVGNFIEIPYQELSNK